MDKRHIIALIIVLILIIGIISWLYCTIRTIHYQKRIAGHVIPDKDIDNYSILDKLLNNYYNYKDRMIKHLKKLLPHNKNYDYSLYADKTISSIFSVFIYLLLSLLFIVKFYLPVCAFILILGFYIPNIYIDIKNSINRKFIERDLLKAISLMNNAFNSGKSMIQAVEVVYIELDGPIAIEFEKIYKDMIHGLSFANAFSRFEKRTCLEEVKYITTALKIIDKTGGDVNEVFSSIEETFYTRRNLDSEFKATVASSRLVFKVLVLIPVLLYIGIGIFDSTYFTCFFSSTIGTLLFSIIVCIYVIYIIIIKNIMQVEKY